MLSTIPIEDFINAVAEKVSEKILPLLSVQSFPKEEEEFLTRPQVSKLIGVSLVTLNEWTNKGIIPAIKIQSRVRYKKSEVLAQLDNLRTFKYKKA